MDGIGQEEMAPVPSFIVETDEEEKNITTIRPKSVVPAARTRSKQTKALNKALTKIYNNFQPYWGTYRARQVPHRQAPLPHHLSYILHLHQRKRHQPKNHG